MEKIFVEWVVVQAILFVLKYSLCKYIIQFKPLTFFNLSEGRSCDPGKQLQSEQWGQWCWDDPVFSVCPGGAQLPSVQGCSGTQSVRSHRVRVLNAGVIHAVGEKVRLQEGEFRGVIYKHKACFPPPPFFQSAPRGMNSRLGSHHRVPWAVLSVSEITQSKRGRKRANRHHVS